MKHYDSLEEVQEALVEYLDSAGGLSILIDRERSRRDWDSVYFWFNWKCFKVRFEVDYEKGRAWYEIVASGYPLLRRVKKELEDTAQGLICERLRSFECTFGDGEPLRLYGFGVGFDEEEQRRLVEALSPEHYEERAHGTLLFFEGWEVEVPHAFYRERGEVMNVMIFQTLTMYKSHEELRRQASFLRQCADKVSLLERMCNGGES